ncbi:MAG TPA: ABC transporter substrate-binding protein [Anaerolineae bacterium]|nr:ABC transporter substrate-binding protein [Anaerolineae bacterium]
MRKFNFLSVILILALLLASCGPTATPTSAPTTEKPPETPAATPEPTKEATPESTPVVREWPEGVVNILTVKLRPGMKWSDGSALTAKDLVGTYNIYWAQNASVWTYLKDVVAVDDTTVEFWIKAASPRALRLILRANQPAPYSVYGKWMDQAANLRAKGEDPKGDAAKALVDDLYAFKPDTVVAYGPFVLDPASVTEAQLELVKNPTGYNAGKIDFNKILVYYGETAASLPLVLSNEVDYSTHGYTPSDVQQIKTIPNLKIFTGPTGTGPGLWFNQNVYPLNKKEVRQAFAYIIDRDENATVAMGEAGKGIQYEAGFTDLQVPAWLSQADIAKLNPYPKDWARAEALLTGIGFKKGSDGIWVDDTGKKLEFELSVPSDFADWLGSAENAAQQLNAFGIKATVRGYPSAERATAQKEGKYQILVDLAIYYNPPHPQTSFNYYLNTPRNAPEATDAFKGMNWSWKQIDPATGKEVYIPDLLTAAAAGFDFEAQKPAIAALARIVNEELPVLALFERYSTDVINYDTRVSGWLPFTDPIYQNNQADLYIAKQLLDGTLKKSATGDGTFHTVYPYPQPPNYDLNLFTTSSLPVGLGNPSYNVMYPPLFYYLWADAKYVPAAAEGYTLESPPVTVEPTPAPLPEGVVNILTVKLRPGMKWSDGSALTAKDLVGTYNIYWAQNASVWTYLKDVVAVDDTTVEFWIKAASPRALRLILRANQPAPYSVYGKWMDQAANLRAKGEDPKGDAAKALVDDLYAFKPDTVVAYGPFVLDPASVTEAQLELVKNPTGYNAGKIDFNKILVYYGETAASLPLVLSNEVDYSTHGYTPSDVQQIKTIPNLKIFTGPTGTGPGLWFNQNVYPLNKKEVRQAFAYIIDRDENATVAMGEAGKGIQYEAGFTDLQVPAWLSQADIAKLNPYPKDWARAEALLTGIGFKKGSDGIWVDDTGKKLEFELSVPSDFADWLGSAENAAQQLNAFGIKATVRGYPSAERATAQKEGKYQILVDLAIYYNPPHPQTSFNYYLNTPRNAPEATDAFKGMNWSWKQIDPATGKEVYIPDLLTAAAAGFDFEAQKPAIAALARIVNEELPVLALFERYSTDVINYDTRVSGWLPFTDPIYQNNQADLYIAKQLLDGTLKKSATGDGTFHTVYPYPQPPNYDLNLFTTSSLPVGLGNPSYNVMYPPLFYYLWADAKYVPAAAASYTLR